MKILTGKVIKNKMQKTVTVLVSRTVAHPMYNKRYKITKKYQVHDEVGVKVGDKVNFVASRPYSKTKRWTIVPAVKSGSKETKKSSSSKKTTKKRVSKSKTK